MEIGKDGIKFISEQQAITSDEFVPTTIGEITLDEMPVEDISVEGIGRIEAVEQDGQKFIRMDFDEAEYNKPDNNSKESGSDPDGFFERLEAKTGIGWDDRKKEFEFPPSEKDRDTFVSFAKFLIDEGHMTKGDLPYQTKYARKAYLLNTEPLNEDGSKMQRDAKVMDGVYMSTYYGIEQKQKYMKYLINDFVKGVSVSIGS